MGYARALLARDVRREEKGLQKKAKKKSLWGSVGRTLGGVAAMVLTGGIVNPLTVGAITAGATFLGGAAGAKASGGKLTGGKFFKSEREDLQGQLGAFGTQNIVSSLKSGLTAGMGQKLELGRNAKLTEGSLGRTGPSVVMKGDAPEFGGAFEDPGQYGRNIIDPFSKAVGYEGPNFKLADFLAEVVHPVHGGSTQEYGGGSLWDKVNPIGKSLKDATNIGTGTWGGSR